MTALLPAPIFLFYLVNSAGESYYVDEMGNVQKRGLATPLVWSPDGWQEMSIGWERNMDKFGLIRNFSLTMGFPGDGGVILEYLFNRENIDFKVSLMVQKLELDVTADDYALVYKFYYRGAIDLSTYRSERLKVLANIMEGGRSADLKANEKTDYEIPLAEDPEAIRVKFNGMKLQNQALSALTNGLPTADPFWNFKNHIVELELIRKEVDDIGSARSTNRTQVQNSNTDIRGTGEYHFHATAAGVVDVTWSGITLQVEYDPAAPGINPAAVVRVVVRRIDKTNFSNFQLELLVTASGNGVPGVYNLAGTGQIAVNPEDELFLYCFCNVQGATGDAQLRFTWSGAEPIFKIDYLFKFPETFVKMFKPIDAYKRLVGRLSGSEDYAVSGLLTASEICITSGNGLRSIEGAVWKSNLGAFYETFKVLKMAGIGVEGDNIVLEAFDHFFNDDLVIDLGEVKERPEISPAIELMANTIKAGYADPKVEDINGKLAFNAEVKWSSPLIRVTRELDLQVPYIADPFYMESVRGKYFTQTTTDEQSDNETFIALVDLANPQVDADGTYYNLKRPVYATIEGIPDPASAYNIDQLTPGRIVRTWKRWLRTIFWLFDGQLIKNEGSSKNNDLATTGGPDGDVREKDDLLIGAADLGDPLFEPKKIKFIAPGAPVMVKTLRDTPSACLRFTRNGSQYKVYLLKAALASKTMAEQEFIGFSHIDNDLKKLENGG